MRLFKDGAFVDDPWHMLGDDEPLGEGPAILSLKAWLALGDARQGINTPVGVKLDAGEMVDALLPDLDRLSLVALSFPKFGDGRAFSKASLLRGQHGFKGEIRAVGDVLWDQLPLRLQRLPGRERADPPGAGSRQEALHGRVLPAGPRRAGTARRWAAALGVADRGIALNGLAWRDDPA